MSHIFIESTMEMMCPSQVHHLQGYVTPVSLITGDDDVMIWVRWYLLAFPTVKLFFLLQLISVLMDML